jgi:hypothetical protein
MARVLGFKENRESARAISSRPARLIGSTCIANNASSSAIVPMTPGATSPGCVAV